MKKRGGLGWGFKEEGQQGANSRPDLQMGKLSPRELKGLDQCSQISQFFERSQKPGYRHLPLLKLPAPNKKHVWDRYDPRAARGSPLTWKSPDSLPSWKQLFGRTTFVIHTKAPLPLPHPILLPGADSGRTGPLLPPSRPASFPTASSALLPWALLTWPLSCPGKPVVCSSRWNNSRGGKYQGKDINTSTAHNTERPGQTKGASDAESPESRQTQRS